MPINLCHINYAERVQTDHARPFAPTSVTSVPAAGCISFYLCVFLLLITPSQAIAQALSVGVNARFRTAGSRAATDTELAPRITSSWATELPRYTAAPTLEVEFAKGFATFFEANRQTFKHRSEFDTYSPTRLTRTTDVRHVNGLSWEFPIVVRKYVPAGAGLRVFPEFGLFLRRTSGTADFEFRVDCRVTSNCSPPPVAESNLVHLWTTRVLVGGGLDIPFGFIHFVPELRYSGRHVLPVSINDWRDHPGGDVTSGPDHSGIDFLFGLKLDVLRK
jgi:hypothetical protein